jgi:hypothetical protein
MDLEKGAGRGMSWGMWRREHVDECDVEVEVVEECGGHEGM